MARRFGRLWSAALAVFLFFILLATYHTLQPLRDGPAIIVEPESKVVLEDSRPVEALVPDTSKETSQDEEQLEPTLLEPDEPEDIEQKLGEQESKSEPVPVELITEDTKSEDAEFESQQPEQFETPQPEPPEPAPQYKVRPGLELKESDEDESLGTDKAVESSESSEEPPGEDENKEAPAPPPPTKIVVMGKLSTEDTDWVSQDLADWQNAIYLVDLPPDEQSLTGLRTKMNKAREAMPYLTYIIDHYPDFPDVVAFIHPHRRGMPKAWHNDARGNDAVFMMHDLEISTILDRGYVNLRCNNEVGCPDEVQPFRDPPDPDRHAEHAFPYVYGHFFNATFSTMREQIPVVATQCCAQFAVSKDQLLKLPKHEYVRYRTFLEETHYDDATSGRVMEYMWHIIFGRDAVHCENMFQCWCAVYGRCFGYARGGRVGSHP